MYLVKILSSVTRDVFFGQPYYIHFYHKHPPHQYTLVSFFYYPYQLSLFSVFSLLLQSKSFISSSPSNHFPVFVGNHRLVPVTYYYLLLYSLPNVFDCMWLSFCIHDDVGKDDVVRIEKGNGIFFCFILWFEGYNLQTAVQFH